MTIFYTGMQTKQIVSSEKKCKLTYFCRNSNVIIHNIFKITEIQNRFIFLLCIEKYSKTALNLREDKKGRKQIKD